MFLTKKILASPRLKYTYLSSKESYATPFAVGPTDLVYAISGVYSSLKLIKDWRTNPTVENYSTFYRGGSAVSVSGVSLALMGQMTSDLVGTSKRRWAGVYYKSSVIYQNLIEIDLNNIRSNASTQYPKSIIGKSTTWNSQFGSPTVCWQYINNPETSGFIARVSVSVNTATKYIGTQAANPSLDETLTNRYYGYGTSFTIPSNTYIALTSVNGSQTSMKLDTINSTTGDYVYTALSLAGTVFTNSATGRSFGCWLNNGGSGQWVMSMGTSGIGDITRQITTGLTSIIATIDVGTETDSTSTWAHVLLGTYNGRIFTFLGKGDDSIAGIVRMYDANLNLLKSKIIPWSSTLSSPSGQVFYDTIPSNDWPYMAISLSHTYGNVNDGLIVFDVSDW